MPRVRMRLIGAKQLAANLRELPDALQPRLVLEAMEYAAEPMVEEGRALAPDAEPLGEGLPAGVIFSEDVSASQNERPAREDEAKAYFGVEQSQAEAILVEFGTGPRYHESGKYVGEMPPQPFIRPAFDNKAGVYLARLTSRLRQLIERAARELGRKSPT